MSETDTPDQFNSKIKWINWQKIFVKFLRALLGKNGIPLSFIYQPRGVIFQDNYERVLDDYIDCAPLNGIEFTTDAAEVHTYLVNFDKIHDSLWNKSSILLD